MQSSYEYWAEKLRIHELRASWDRISDKKMLEISYLLVLGDRRGVFSVDITIYDDLRVKNVQDLAGRKLFLSENQGYIKFKFEK